MAYIGKAPNTAIVNQATSQSFSGNGSTTAFTLTRSVNVGEDLEVFVNNVQQEPGSGKSYTASGKTLTFDEAPPSGTNNVYVIYRGEATINPRLEHDANNPLAATTGTFSGAVSGTDGTFTGDLTVETSSSGEFNALTISQGNNTSGNESRIRFKRTTDAGSDREVAAIVADRVGGNDTALVFETNTDGSDGATERVRINQDGNVGIGNASPSQLLSVGGDSSGTKVIQVTNSVAGTAFNDGMQMFINDTAGGLNMRENYPLQIYVNGAERARFLAGGGITFNGDTVAANALNDYEEGAWTPTISIGTISYSYAYYTKVGNLVTLNLNVHTISDRTDTGIFLIGGLPYTSSSNNRAIGAVMHRYIDDAGEDVTAWVDSNVSSLKFYLSQQSSNWQQVRHVDLMSASAQFYMTITYQAA